MDMIEWHWYLYIESAQHWIALWYKVKQQAMYMTLKIYIIKEKVVRNNNR